MISIILKLNSHVLFPTELYSSKMEKLKTITNKFHY